MAETRPSRSRSSSLNCPAKPAAPDRIPEGLVVDDDDELAAPDCTGVWPFVAPGVRSMELVESDCVRVDGWGNVPEAASERESVDVPELGVEEEPLPVDDPDVELELGVEDEPELPAAPDDAPELCAMAGIATKARLLEKSTEISCREGFVFMVIG